jgi:hypothetical protein
MGRLGNICAKPVPILCLRQFFLKERDKGRRDEGSIFVRGGSPHPPRRRSAPPRRAVDVVGTPCLKSMNACHGRPCPAVYLILISPNGARLHRARRVSAPAAAKTYPATAGPRHGRPCPAVYLTSLPAPARHVEDSPWRGGSATGPTRELPAPEGLTRRQVPKARL